jgi:hypothetical protein
MQWPPEIFRAFERGLEVVPMEGYTPEQIYQNIFDETARRALWRCKGDLTHIRGCLRWPFTPLGSIVPGCSFQWAKSLCLKGPEWGKAVDALHNYIEHNVQAVYEVFQDELEPYDDLSGEFAE